MKADDSGHLNSLIARGEHQELDFKFEISDARKIARTLSAFANTDGGTLLIGVKDNGRITGVRSDEEFYMVEAAASLYCKPEVLFDSYQRQAEGKTVLEIYIPPVARKPVYAKNEKGKWLAYVRVADENMLASIIHLKLWQEESTPLGSLLEYTRKEKILLNLMDSEKQLSLRNLQKNSGFPRRELIDMLGKLVRFNVVGISYAEGEARFFINEHPGE